MKHLFFEHCFAHYITLIAFSLEAWFLFLTTSRWLAVRLDAICALFVIAIAFGSLILSKSKLCFARTMA